MKNVKTIVAITALAFSSVCLAADPVVKSAIGGALGGAAGAAVGQEVGGKNGAVVGGAVGGALGGAVSKCGTGAVVGGAVGGGAGAAIGQHAGGKTGAVVGGGAGGAVGAAVGCSTTSDKKPQQVAAKPAPTAVAVVTTSASVETGGDCGRKHNKGKGWAKGHAKKC
jgi:hypothetical protein